MFEYKGIKIRWLGHDSFLISNGKRICIDPFKLSRSEAADIVLVTHEHHDHFSPDDLKKVVGPSSTIVTIKLNEKGAAKLGARTVLTVKPGDIKQVEGLTVQAVPAYNVSKFREPGKVFHPKGDGRVGFILTIGGVRIYHAGDTDAIPEMSQIKTDIALLPVSGTYVMTAEEAGEAARMIKPTIAIPMHYGAIVGSETDAQRFKSHAQCQVEILKPE